MSGTLRVVIAEDNYLVREGVRRLLEDSGEIEVVACVGDARELLDAVRRLTSNVVLTDIRMPPGHHMEGIEAARAIRTEHPKIGVVVLSQHTDESYARALFNDGSAGLAYLLKDRVGDLEDLVRALNGVAAGGSVVDSVIIDTLVARQQTRVSSPLATLTPRELDVLREMAQGKTNAGIEQALFLSASTVEKHVNAIFTKLGISAAPVHRRVVAVLAFLENAPAPDRLDGTQIRVSTTLSITARNCPKPSKLRHMSSGLRPAQWRTMCADVSAIAAIAISAHRITGSRIG
jgi:DNA-binding NarL/FixJ family response regulator